MASCDTASATNAGGADYTAFVAWVQTSLSHTFDAALHEPLPSDLLAILDSGLKADAASVNIRN